MEFGICDLEGGVADNAIPISASAKILFTGYENANGNQKFHQDGFSIQEGMALLKHRIELLNKELKEELADKDSAVEVSLVAEEAGETKAIPELQTKKLVALLHSIPHGVQAMSASMQGLVETSLNPGILRMQQERMSQVEIEISVRSSINSGRKALMEQLKSIAYLAGADVQIFGEYPGWSYRQNSPLRDTMVNIYHQIYQKTPEIMAIHAGVECGLLADKIPDLDCVSIGPDMEHIHTTKERLNISSTKRVWNYLLKLMEAL